MEVSKFSSVVRERSVHLVLEQEAQHKSQWQAVTSVALKLGCHAVTVLSWVRQYERDGGRREGSTSTEKERIKALERRSRSFVGPTRSCAWSVRFSQSRSSTARASERVHRSSSGGILGRTDLQGPAACLICPPASCAFRRKRPVSAASLT